MNTHRLLAAALFATLALAPACGKRNASKGGSSTLAVQLDDKAVKLPNALVQANTQATDPNKQYGLSFTTYDSCDWWLEHSYESFPRDDFSFLVTYLINRVGGTLKAPEPGTYQVGLATGDGKFVDASTSAFANVKECKGSPYLSIVTGTVTLTEVDTASKPAMASGSIDVQLADGSKLTGSFKTATCVLSPEQQPPADQDPDACDGLK